MKSEEKNPLGSLISFLSVTVIISASFITCKFTSLWVHRFPNSGKGRSVSVHPWAPPHTHSITLRVGNLIAEVFLLSLNLHSCCKTDVPERECGLLISYTEKDEADGTQRERLAWPGLSMHQQVLTNPHGHLTPCLRNSCDSEVVREAAYSSRHPIPPQSAPAGSACSPGIMWSSACWVCILNHWIILHVIVDLLM